MLQHSPAIVEERHTAGAGCAIDEQLTAQPYRRRDRTNLFRLLSGLPTLYPDAREWLDQRLEDSLTGRASCVVVVDRTAHPVAVMIQTPKGRLRTKLSTIFVHPYFRGRGVGSFLLDQAICGWVKTDVSRVDLTVDVGTSAKLLPLLVQRGFAQVAIERERYGANRNEMVLSWVR